MKKKLLIIGGVSILLASSFVAFNIVKRFLEKSSVSKVNLKQDSPELASYVNYIQTVDNKEKRVPVERLFKVQSDLMQNKYRDTTQNVWSQVPTEMGGRTRALVFDPNDTIHKKVWAGSVSGGLWYNNDITSADSSWMPVSDFWNSLSVSSIVFDPLNSQIMYVGTGEAETAVTTYRQSGGLGAGIMKSTDGGKSWDLLNSTTSFDYITDMVIRVENGVSVIYAGVASGIYMGQVHNSIPQNGLYRSVDNGTSWSQVLPNIEGSSEIAPVSDIALSSDGRIFVGTMNNVQGNYGSLIYYSDLGTENTWTLYHDVADSILNSADFNLTGRVELATAPSDSSYVYAFFAVGTNNNLSMGFPTWEAQIVQKSTNKGETWSNINIPDGGSMQWAYLAWHALDASVDPNNPNVVWAGGLDLYRTDDGGNSWINYSDWAQMYYGGGDNYVHGDQHVISYRPGSSSEVIFASDGGIFFTSSANASNVVFQERNKNYNTLQFYSCSISKYNDASIQLIGGAQDNGSLVYQDSVPLSPNGMVSGGDGGYCLFDPYVKGAYVTSVYENRFWIYKDDSHSNYVYDFQSGTFTSPFVVNFQTGNLYANAVTFTGEHAGDILQISNMYGNYNGQYISTGIGNTSPFTSMCLTPNEASDHVLAGTASGNIYLLNINNSLINATEITGDDMPDGYISSINTASTEDTIIVTFSNYGVNSIWLTLDRGLTWTCCDGNLPDIPVRYAIFHPENSKQVRIATEAGVWETNNIFKQNVIWNVEYTLPFVRVDMLAVRNSDNKMVAATHGRGLFTSDWKLCDYSAIESLSCASVKVYPNPSRTNFVNVILPQNGEYCINICDLSGRVIKALNGYGHSGQHVHVNFNQKGTFVMSLNCNNDNYSNKLIFE